MKFCFKIIAWLLAAAILFSFCGCSKTDTESGASSGIPANVSDSSARVDSSLPVVSAADTSDDTQDPENTEDGRGEGQKVKAEQLTHKTGQQNGIDVSKWQGKIDWTKVKKSGIDFAIIRIGYRGENGTVYKDKNADYNIQQAIKAGVLVGVYFFSTAKTTAEAREEAAFTLSAIKGYSISYPVVYDCEGYANSESRMNALSATQRTDNAMAFLSAVENAGYEGMFYAAKSDLENGSWETARLESGYKIWVAHYTSPAYPDTKAPDYTGKYDMWQYTNKGSVSGVSGNCDMVVSYFTRSLKAPKDSSAAPEAADVPKSNEELVHLYTYVNETVTAKDEVNLRTGAGTNYDIAGTLKNGERLTRTAIGSNGWSRLSYNGKTVYAITSYLTTDLSFKTPTEPKEDIVAGNTFTAKYDKVTAKNEVNLRSLPTTESEVVATLKSGEFLQRSATSNRGWSRLIYNGKTVYAVTSYLTTEVISTPAESSQGSSADGFQPATGRVTAKSETNLRTAPTTNGSEVVYTLKNGEYVDLTGKSSTGWSRVVYNGQTLYAITSYLTE